MKTKFTKGPWNIEYHEALDTFRVKTADETVGIICGTKQNAALIASAPEMFQMLEKALLAFREIELKDNVFEHAVTLEIESILKKARGE